MKKEYTRINTMFGLHTVRRRDQSNIQFASDATNLLKPRDLEATLEILPGVLLIFGGMI